VGGGGKKKYKRQKKKTWTKHEGCAGTKATNAELTPREKKDPRPSQRAEGKKKNRPGLAEKGWTLAEWGPGGVDACVLKKNEARKKR